MFTSNLTASSLPDSNSLFTNQPTANQNVGSLFSNLQRVPAEQRQESDSPNSLFGTTPSLTSGIFGPVPDSFLDPQGNQPNNSSLFGFGRVSLPRAEPPAPRGGLFDGLVQTESSEDRGLFPVIRRAAPKRPAAQRRAPTSTSDRIREKSEARDGTGEGTIPFGSLFTQPALTQRQVSVAEPADGSPFTCPVCCNDYSTSDKDKSKRPHNYECGHTMCLSCIEKLEDEKCPFCNKPGRALSSNYGLENAIDWIKQSNSRSSELKMYQTHSLCLKCLETFDPNQKNLFSSNHKGHESIPLKDKSPEEMKKVFWLLSVLKTDGPTRFERAKVMLRMLLDIVETYMQALDVVETQLKAAKQSTTEELLEDIKTFISNPLPENTQYLNKSLIDSLLIVRELEVTKAQGVFSLARECQPGKDSLLTEEFFSALKKDTDEYVPVGMPEQYLGKFEMLLFPDEEPPQGEITEKQAPGNWLQSWRASLAR